METEQEELLTQHLKEGVEVYDLSPHMYYKGFAFYEVHVRMRTPKKVFILQVKVKQSNMSNVMRIHKVYELIAGQKTEVSTKLMYRRVAFVPRKNLIHFAKSDPLSLDGEFFLQ